MLKLPVDWTRTSLPAVGLKAPPLFFFPAFRNSETIYFGLVEWRSLSSNSFMSRRTHTLPASRLKKKGELPILLEIALTDDLPEDICKADTL